MDEFGFYVPSKVFQSFRDEISITIYNSVQLYLRRHAGKYIQQLHFCLQLFAFTRPITESCA